MRKQTFSIYKFEELSPKARERAIKDHGEFLRDMFDVEMLTDDFKYQLEEQGLPTDQVYWRLGYSQGDGVGFYGKVDLKKFLAVRGIAMPEGLTEMGEDFEQVYVFSIEKINSYYDHYNSGRAKVDRDDYAGDEPESWEPFASDLLDEIDKAYREWSRKLERDGYEQIEDEEKEENIIESIKINEYEFYPDGTIYHTHSVVK
jgi:hypothetical protein